MNLQHGHIYFVEFDPSSGHEFQKMRPAVILSSNELILRSNLISCVPFTGNSGNYISKDDLLVKKTGVNNLFTNSVLKIQHLSTFDKNRIKKYIGELEQSLLKKLKDIVIRNFNLSNNDI